MPETDHQTELYRLATFCAGFVALSLLPYAVGPLSELKPWIPGEPLPLLGLLEQNVTLNRLGELQRTLAAPEPAPEPTTEALGSTADTGGQDTGWAETADTGFDPEPLFWPPAAARRALPDRSPGTHEPMLVPPGALDHYFEALAAVEDGEPGRISRALVWGDSIIAADQVISDIRRRAQARFGDGGPGFLAVQVDPYWSLRSDISRTYSGAWENHTIVSTGSPDYRYGLSGVASTATGEAAARIGTRDKEAPLTERVQLFYLRQPGGGTMSVSMRGGGVRTSTDAERRYDVVSDFSASGRWLSVKATGDGPVTFFGAALETAGPGVTWETFGIAGAHIGAMNTQGRSHLRNQIEKRDPDLLVYWTGGNELSYPSLKEPGGETYRRIYRRVVDKLRAGAPDASCLLIGPLDQATRYRGRLVSKEGVETVVRLQRQVAREAGCAYWDAYTAMGGEGAFVSWMQQDPPLAVPDLMHLTREGGTVIGDLLTDVLLGSYDLWRDDHPDAGWQPPESEP